MFCQVVAFAQTVKTSRELMEVGSFNCDKYYYISSIRVLVLNDKQSQF